MPIISIFKIFIAGFTIMLFCLLEPSPLQAKTGIMVALSATADQIESAMVVSHIRHYAQRRFVSGKLSEADIVLVRSPMGMINNAITAQVLISHFEIGRLISLAPAGALSDPIEIGDLVIARQVWQHDFGTIKPYGFLWGKTPDGSGNLSKGYQYMDETMVKIAQKTAETMNPFKNRFHEGIVAGGDSFIADNEKRGWIAKKFDALAVDMGSPAIAQVCYASRVPCLILRVITDKAGINARINFSKSLPAYRSAIDIRVYLASLISVFSSQ